MDPINGVSENILLLLLFDVMKLISLGFKKLFVIKSRTWRLAYPNSNGLELEETMEKTKESFVLSSGARTSSKELTLALSG
jgi:hypothetical protein